MNLLVGANNSGKSRMMRLVAATERLRVVPGRQFVNGENFDLLTVEVRKLGLQIRGILAETKAEVNALDSSADALAAFRYLVEAKPLGDFIEQKVLIDPSKKKRTGSYAKDKTISDKSGFCVKTIAATSTWQNVSEESQSLTVRVFDFITRNNTRIRHSRHRELRVDVGG